MDGVDRIRCSICVELWARDTMLAMPDTGYVNYFEILDLDETAKQGEVRKNYKNKMKHLVMEIATVEITEGRRAHYLREMAKLNAAFYILRDNDKREAYWRQRSDLMALAEEWRQAVEAKTAEAQKAFDGVLENLTKNAPAGSETAVAAFKSALTAGQNAIETAQAQAKKAVETAQSTFTAAATQAADAVKKATTV